MWRVLSVFPEPRRRDQALFAGRRRKEAAVQDYVRGEALATYRRDCPGAACDATRAVIAARCRELMGHNGLREYQVKHGCTKATLEAITAIKRRGKSIVELGAGNGHWCAALREAGVDVDAFDDMSALPVLGDAKGVSVGGVSVLKDMSNRDLLLVYPPPGPFAFECLNSYQGDCLVYVGEPRGGANADSSFFDALHQNWRLAAAPLDLEPFPGGCERLFILVRRNNYADLMSDVEGAFAVVSEVVAAARSDGRRGIAHCRWC